METLFSNIENNFAPGNSVRMNEMNGPEKWNMGGLIRPSLPLWSGEGITSSSPDMLQFIHGVFMPQDLDKLNDGRQQENANHPVQVVSCRYFSAPSIAPEYEHTVLASVPRPIPMMYGIVLSPVGFQKYFLENTAVLQPKPERDLTADGTHEHTEQETVYYSAA